MTPDRFQEHIEACPNCEPGVPCAKAVEVLVEQMGEELDERGETVELVRLIIPDIQAGLASVMLHRETCDECQEGDTPCAVARTMVREHVEQTHLRKRKTAPLN